MGKTLKKIKVREHFLWLVVGLVGLVGDTGDIWLQKPIILRNDHVLPAAQEVGSEERPAVPSGEG